MKRQLRQFARALPQPAQDVLRRVRDSRRVRRAVQPVRWGNLRRVEPVSARWGSERGHAVDRVYIDAFFARHAGSITGRVLEVRDPRYCTAHGRNVSSIDIVDIDPRNDSATIVADLARAGSLPVEAFDCVIVPQTLQYVSDPFVAVANLWQSLAPGGTLLVTVPCIIRVDPDAPGDDRWRFTEPGLAEVLQRSCDGGSFDIASHGNPLVAIAFLEGITQEELRESELSARHPLFPIVVTAVARKPR